MNSGDSLNACFSIDAPLVPIIRRLSFRRIGDHVTGTAVAKKAAGGRELSFHKASKRWCKSDVFDGKKLTEYFCSGRSANDERGHRREGLPICCGPVESNCKQLGRRLKGPAMRWRTDNLIPMAHPLSLWTNQRWDHSMFKSPA